jgi:hypothetical protein
MRGRLIALFVSVATVAAVTFTVASSAKSVRNLLPGRTVNTNLSNRAATQNELPATTQNNAARPGFLSSAASRTSEDTPTITTDKDAYEPGETITFTGANWTPGEIVTIVLNDETGGVEATPLQATADESGAFTITGTMPGANTVNTSAAKGVARSSSAAAENSAVYTATATGATSGATAQVQIKEGAAGESDADENDPDLPAFMAGRINKDDYLRRREEHINKLRGIVPGRPVDPGARGRAISEMNRQEGRSNNATSTINAVPSNQTNANPSAVFNLNTPTSSSTWSAIGPYPLPNGQTFNTNSVAVSGRTVAIAIHPTNSNIAYVGAAQGGVYRTLDGGATWTPIFDNAQSLAIGSIAIAPSQPSTIYVGTGEGNFGCDTFAGVGVYRIDNADGPSPTMTGPLNKDAGGNDVLSGWATGKIVVHPTNPDIIFIGTTTGYAGQNCFPVNDTTATATKPRGLFRSTNATSANPTFTKLTIAGVLNGGNRSVSDIEFEPGNPDNLLATVFGGGSAGNDAGVYRTTNALAASPTFTRTLAVGDTTTTYRTEIAINKIGSQVNVFAATSEANGTFKRSTNGGVTWSGALGTSGFCGGQCAYDIPIAVDPTNANIVYLGGPGDSGSAHILTKVTNALGTPTFTASQAGLHADEHAIEIDPNNTSIIWTGNDGGIFKSTNAAGSWTSMNNTGYSATQFVSLAVHSTDANFTIGGTQDNGTECQGPCGTFTGNTWNQADYGDGGFALIDQSSTSLTSLNMYHTYYNQTSTLIGYAYVTSTANAKFTNSPTSNSWSFNGTGGAVSCTSGGGYACSEAVEFYMPMTLGPGTPNPIYSGTDRLHRAATPGASNSTVSQVFVSGVPITAIGISRQSDLVRIVGLENGKVFRTLTGQTTGWPDVSGTLPTSAAYYLSRAVIDPNNQNTAYVTYSTYFGNSTSHIYKTTNLNATTPTWTGIDGGQIPDIPINAFVVDPADSTKLYAGTDIGVYRSTDGGATWSPFSNGLPRVSVFDMAIQNSNRILRIATHGRGMWEISLNAPVAPGTLQGTVTNSATSAPVSGATVTAGANTTTTNASGFYVFGEIAPATYSVTAAAPGYNNSAAVNAVVTSGNTTTQNFALTPAPTSACLTDTSQADFQAGTASSVDTTTTPGSVILASGAETLDQQQTNTGNAQGLTVSTTTWTGNTFTPAISGKLTKIDASFFNLANLSGGSVVVEIRTTSGGLPTSTIVPGGTATFSIGGTTSGFYTATFSSPPTLTAGTQYAYVAHTTSGSCAMHRRSNGATDYAGGTNVQSANSGSTWAANDPDVAFRTYMSAGFTASGDLTSSIKDSNPASGVSPNWTTLSWTATTPANTTIKFQAASSNVAAGPFNFVGPDGTAATFFTTSGASLSQFSGKRYLKYKAYLSTNSSSVTPTLNDVTVCFANGALPSTTTVSTASGTYGGTAALTATLTSGGSPLSGKLVTFTLNGGGVGSGITNASGVATLSNASLAGINAGSYPNGVGASFAGDASYQASSGSNSLTVSKATPTITWNNPANIVYGTALSATQLNATASVPGSFVYTPAAGTVLHAGNGQTLHAAFTPTDTTNYNTAAQDVSINVTKATLTVKADDKSRAYGDANPPLTYTMTGFVNSDTQASATTGQPAITTTADNTSAPGNYTITAALGTLTAADYQFIFVNGTLMVTKANQTINFGALATKTYGDADFTVSATASSGLAVSFAASGNCTVTGNNVHLTGAGACMITASQGGNTNYNAAPSVPQSFTINKADSTTTVSVNNATYNGQPHGATASVAGFGGLNQSLTVTYAGRNGTSYGPSTTAPTNAGDYTASATFSGDSDHNSSSDSKDYTIAKANAVINITPYSVTYDGGAHTAAGTAAGVESPSPADLSSLLDLSGTTHTNASGYPTDAWSFAGNNNYNPASGTVSDQIDMASSTVTVNCPASATYTGAALEPCTASYSGAGGLTGTLTPTYTDNVNVGTAHVSATYGGDANHTGSSNSANFEITKAATTTTVTCPQSATYTGAAITPCTVSVTGANLNLSPAPDYANNVNVGTASASYTYAGDANHTGSNGSANFDITKAATTVTVICPPSVTYNGAAQTPCSATVTGANLSQPLTVNYTNNTNAGTANASAAYAGDANHTGNNDAKNFTIDKANASISVTPYSVTYDGNAHTATGTTKGVLNENLSGLNLSGTTHTNAGTYNGDSWTFTDSTGNYNDASGTVNDQIAQAGSTTTVTVSNATYDGQPHGSTAAVTGAGGLNQSLTVTYSGTLVNGTPYGPTTVAPTNAGSYTASATYGGDANHTGSSNSKSFQIAQATATIALSNLYYLYDGQPHGATATTNPAGLSGVNFLYVGQTLSYNSAAPPTAAGTYMVTASLSNNNYAAAPVSATFVINAAPAVTIAGPASGAIYTKGSTVSFTGTFIDNPGTHTAVWTFTSGTQTINVNGTVNEATGAVSASYTFAATGVYTLKLTVTDNFSVLGVATTVNNVASAPALIAVYDPSSTGGSVSTTTKSPLYNSLAGWCLLPGYTNTTGTATTGFNASYPSATATAPTGQAVFNFTAANLSFASLSYKWMVVSKPYVWLRGTGAVNNVSGYEFLIAAVDGQLTGGGGTDKFRIRIWKSADGTIIYDNMPNAPLNAVAVTTTSNGDTAIK